MSIIKQAKDPSQFVKYGNGVHYYNKTKPELGQFFQKINKPIAVIGSAPTLTEDVKKLPKDCLYYAVNFHFLEKDIFDFTYLSYLDNPERAVMNPYRHFYENFEGVTITNHLEWTDIYVVNEEPLICGDSGIFSLWVALYLTTEKVYACGMNNRASDRMYHPDSWLAGSQYNNWQSPDRVKYGRWHMLFEQAHNPERLVIFDKGVGKFLKDRKWKFNES